MKTLSSLWFLGLSMFGCAAGAGVASVESDGGTGGSGGAPPVLHVHDAAPPPPPALPSLHLTYSDPVAPGVERGRCLDIPGPAVDTWISGWHAERGTGSHHIAVEIRRAGAPYTVPTDCSPDPRSQPVLLVALQPTFDYSLPADAAYFLPAHSSLVLEVHELNTGVDPVTTTSTVELRTTPQRARTANTVILLARNISVPPGVTQTVGSSCAAPTDLDLLMLSGHSHAHSTLVTASVAGQEIYRSTTWAEPVMQQYTGLHVTAGSAISWQCTIANTTSATLTFGASRDKNEMCGANGVAITPAPVTCFN